MEIHGFKNVDQMWKYFGIYRNPRLKYIEPRFVFHNKVSKEGEIYLIVYNSKLHKIQFVATTEADVEDNDDFNLLDALEKIKFNEFKQMFQDMPWYKKFREEIEAAFVLKESKFKDFLKTEEI